MTLTNITFKGRGGNVIGSLGSGSLVQEMPSAMVFNGTTTHASSSATYTGLDATDNFTVAWWMKRGSNQNARVINVDSAASELFYARIDGTGDASDLEVFVDAATDGYVGAGTAGDFASDGTEWQHYTVVYDTATLKLYRNGVNIVNDSTINGNTANSNGPLYIGSYHSGGTPRNPHFDGSIRDMRIFTSGLTATQVTSVFEDIGMNGIGVTPVNWYYMEEGTGTTLNDSGSANIDLGIVSGSWDASMYNLNQIGLGSLSGTATINGGTWNLKNSTYLRPTGTNNTNANYVQFNDDQQLDGSRSYAMWFYLSSKTSTQVMLSNYNSSNEGTQIFLNGGTTDLYLRLNNSNVNYITANENEWNHLVWTIDETNNLAKGYLNGIEVTSSANDRTYGTVENMRLGADVKAEYPVNDGNYFSEYAYYTSVLTPVQVDLIYRGNWTGGPNTWIKLDEGTGTSVTNHGTSNVTATLTGSGSTTPAWVNPTYTKGGAGTSFTNDIYITSGTSISAPRGIFDWTSDASFVYFKVDNPDTTTTWIHNSGTLAHSGGNNKNFNLGTSAAGSGATFYNVSSSSMLSFGYGTAEVPNNWWIENEWKLDSTRNGVYNGTNSPVILTLGTDTTSGSILEGSLGTQDGGDKRWTIQAKNELFPVHMDTTFYCYNGGNTLTLKDVNWASANNFGDGSYGSAGNTVNVVISGNVEFAGEVDLVDTTSIGLNHLTVSNDSRAKFGGNLDMDSDTTFVGSGALIICDDKIKTDGASVYNSGTSVICGHAGTSTIRFNSGDWENLMYNPTGGGVCFDTNANVANNLIVAGGYYDMQTAHLSGGGVGKLQIATGGEFRGGDGTNHLITDTFNQRGGFIGQGAYSGDGANDNFMQIWNSDISDLEFGTGSLTVEAWVKASAAGGLIGSYWGSDLPMYQLDIGSGTATNMRILATGAGGASTDGLTQVDAPATTNVIDGKWHHVVGVRDTSAGLVKLYIDGKLENESSDAATVAEGGDTDNGQRKMVGSRGYYGELDGEIARASYWKVALTEAEIRGMMFQDWATMAAANVIDDSKCVGWYEFSDDQDATSVTDMTGSGNTGTLSSTDLWAAAGTFTYETSTLEFDNNGGTCNLYGPVSGPTPAVSGLTITNGTTMTIDCSTRDFYCYGPLVNSGTTTAIHNFQYRNRSAPIVGASSDLTFGGKIFYYFGDGSGLPASGAGTNYSQLRPGTNLWMQGDFDCSNHLLQSGGELHLNGYTCSTTAIYNYGGGNIWAEPGSSIEFDTTGGFNKMYGASPTTMTFVASGESAAMFTNNKDAMYISTGVSGTYNRMDSFSTSFWVKVLNNSTDAGLITKGWTGDLSFYISLHSNGTLRFYSWHQENGGPSGGNSSVSTTALDDGNWHHIATTYDSSSGVKEVWVDGTREDNDTTVGGTLDSTPAIFGIGNWFSPSVGNAVAFSLGADRGSMADVRLWDGTVLTSGNIVTLAATNPATNASGAYADNPSDPSSWWKLGNTGSGLPAIDLNDYGTNGYDAVMTGSSASPAGMKSGFVTINSTATPYEPINRIYPAGVTLINTYMSGSKDIIVGQTYESTAGITAHSSQTLKTKGTVVLD